MFMAFETVRQIRAKGLKYEIWSKSAKRLWNDETTARVIYSPVQLSLEIGFVLVDIWGFPTLADILSR